MSARIDVFQEKRLNSLMNNEVSEREKSHVPVAESFEHAILRGDITIGDRLPSEADIAHTFNVSTRSVREAIQVLETKGLIKRKHGERAMVVRNDINVFLEIVTKNIHLLHSQSKNYFDQLIDLSRILESEAVDRISNGNCNINLELNDTIVGMESAVDGDDLEQFLHWERQFRTRLVKSLNNNVLISLYANITLLIDDSNFLKTRLSKQSLKSLFEKRANLYAFLKQKDKKNANLAYKEMIEAT